MIGRLTRRPLTEYNEGWEKGAAMGDEGKGIEEEENGGQTGTGNGKNENEWKRKL